MPRNFRTRTFTVVALTLSFGVLCQLAFRVLNPAIAKTSASPQAAPKGCVSCADDADADKPHLLAASYYSLNDNLTATLMLNNKGPKPLEVKPTLYSLGGQRLELPPVTVEGMSFRELDMRDFGIAGTPFQEGSLQLFHLGKDLVLGAQVKLLDQQRSLIFEEKLLEVQTEVGLRRLEGVWWLPSPRGQVKFVLSNTGDGPLSVAATVDGSSPRQKDPFVVTLAAHETRVIDAQEDVVGKRGGSLARIGGVTLEHTGGAGALLARVMMQDVGAGYSVSARFYDPQKGQSAELHGAGLRIGSVGGVRLTPTVVARNVGAAATSVTGRIPYTGAGGETGAVTLPPLQLAPGETGIVDVQSALRRSGIEGGIASAGLEFEHTNEPGSVIMLAQSVSRNGDHAFTVPMWDTRAQRSSTGGYPWKIEGDSSTLAYLKNVTDEPQRYVLTILFEGGAYTTGMKTVRAGQTDVIDVRALRDSQVADEQGTRIPLDATRGQIQWSIKGPKNLVMVGRSEQVDAAQGISTSYACQNCCPNTFYDGYITPEDIFTFPGDTNQFTAMERDISCYGYISTPWQATSPFWESNDEAVAWANYMGLATSEDVVGVATLTASWTVDTWFKQLGNYCEYTPVETSAIAYVENQAAEPHHVRVIVDQSGFPAACPTTGIFVRQIQVQVVNQNNRDVTSQFSVQESYANLTTNTCGNGNPVASPCAAADQNGRFLDTMAVSGNFCNSGISQGSGCGFSLTSTWSVCAGFTARNIWTSTRDTRSNRVTVNGRDTNYSPGTQLFP